MSRDGNPAFPCGDTTGVQPWSGMSLLDYFAAHAPAEKWAWFEPKMPSRPTMPMRDPVANDGQAPSDDELSNLRSWLIDPCWDASENFPGFSYWVKQWTDYWTDSRQWDAERIRQRDIQWPWFYAHKMLKARDE